ncbi:MAG: hypothetical protein NZZ41_03490 [Candidatus Dojkabacteria bacterium]|nr:hypothetical protein [Candidatus Dojkabacteria bacterium]
MNMNWSLLRKLSEIHSVTGDTRAMTNFIVVELNKLGVLNFVNHFGTVIAGDYRNAKLMFAAHIDQVGFQITKINPDGTCSILPIGWVFPNRLDHVPIYVNTLNGFILGAAFHKNRLKAENIDRFSDLFAFFGTTSAEDTKKLGLSEGDFGSFKKEYWENETSIFSSGIDNIVSIFVLLEEIRQNPSILDNVMIAFHNDEEMQDHGANSLSYEYAVEYCCILDYCPVSNQFEAEDIVPSIHEGPFIVYRGGSHILHEDLRQKLSKLSIPRAFISNITLPSLEPQNFQNNGVTKAFNYCIPAMGYHGSIYAVLKKNIIDFQAHLRVIKQILLD